MRLFTDMIVPTYFNSPGCPASCEFFSRPSYHWRLIKRRLNIIRKIKQWCVRMNYYSGSRYRTMTWSDLIGFYLTFPAPANNKIVGICWQRTRCTDMIPIFVIYVPTELIIYIPTPLLPPRTVILDLLFLPWHHFMSLEGLIPKIALDSFPFPLFLLKCLRRKVHAENNASTAGALQSLPPKYNQARPDPPQVRTSCWLERSNLPLTGCDTPRRFWFTTKCMLLNLGFISEMPLYSTI